MRRHARTAGLLALTAAMSACLGAFVMDSLRPLPCAEVRHLAECDDCQSAAKRLAILAYNEAMANTRAQQQDRSMLKNAKAAVISEPGEDDGAVELQEAGK